MSILVAVFAPIYFPAFGRGLSLRPTHVPAHPPRSHRFPRLRAGTFIEAKLKDSTLPENLFPRLRAGTFIEARRARVKDERER